MTAETWATKLDVEAQLVEYLAALDQMRFADAASCFTDDGVLLFDDVRLTGRAEIEASMQRQLGVLDLTHHTISNVRVDVDGDTASLRAHAIGTHLWTVDGDAKQALLGGSYAAELIRTNARWRLRLLAPAFLWTVGDPWDH